MLIAATSPAIYLLALACPIGMGVMMLFMGKGMMGGSKRDQKTSDATQDEHALADLKAEQARLAEKIAGLEAKQVGDLPHSPQSTNGQEAQPVARERAR